MKIQWKPSEPERQFRTEQQKESQQRYNCANHQKHSAELVHTDILAALCLCVSVVLSRKHRATETQRVFK